MTERMPPDDRELEQYLKGNSPLSRRYRDASSETAPPELDEAILARARAELRRKPAGLNRWLASVALAASVVLGVNLAWNVYQVQPVPGDVPFASDKVSRDEGFVPSPPPTVEAPTEPAAPRVNAPAAPAEPAPRPEHKARAAEAPALQEQPEASGSGAMAAREDDALAQRAQAARDSAKLEQREAFARESEESARREPQLKRAPAAASAPAAAMADAAPLAESEKIDRLIRYIAALEGAVFIRNGTEHGPAEAAQHLQSKREKAGDRVKTADDFIRLCASHSTLSGEAYLIRFADGHTRTAEDVLREELARIEGRQ